MIIYVTGDATQPIGDGNKIIAHICNDVGAWGAGFVMALSRRWKEPEAKFRTTIQFETALGLVQFVSVQDDIVVANIIGQHGVGHENGPPIRYDAVRDGLRKVAERAKAVNATVHMPRIGCGLAGGRWDIMKAIIQETLVDVPVTVYDLPGK